jgi:hypothetical protein
MLNDNELNNLLLNHIMIAKCTLFKERRDMFRPIAIIRDRTEMYGKLSRSYTPILKLGKRQ